MSRNLIKFGLSFFLIALGWFIFPDLNMKFLIGEIEMPQIIFIITAHVAVLVAPIAIK